MDNIATMTEGASVLVLSALGLIAIRSRLGDSYWRRSVSLGLMFATVGLMTMNNPVILGPGVRVDPRAAVVVMSAAFGGPLSGFLTAVTLAWFRIYLGGAGALAGVTYTIGTAILASAFFLYWFRDGTRTICRRYVLVQAAISAAVPSVIVFAMTTQPPEIYLHSVLLFMPTNFASVWILGVLVLRGDERRMALARQAEIEARMKAIVANASVVLVQIAETASGQFKFGFVSDGIKSILGVTPAAMMQDRHLFGQMTSDQDHDALCEALARSRLTGDTVNLECECCRHDSKSVWINLAATPRRLPDGQFVWDGTINDITHRKANERMKDEFISVVSHELRTPLTSIRGALGLVSNGAGGALPDRARGMIEIARRNSERLVLLINDILDLERIRTGRMKFAIDRQSVRQMVQNAIAASANYAPEKTITVSLLDHAPRAEIMVDAVRFEQAMANFLSNAVKFSPAGSEVVVRSELVPDGVRISVADAGPGISEEFQSRIFGRFEQAEGADDRREGGTGLGLNITRAIAEGMSGSIGFTSVSGSGSVFYVTFPEAPSGLGADQREIVNRSKDGRRVLICGCDPETNIAVALALDARDVWSDTAPTAKAALKLMNEREYGGVLVDASVLSEALADLGGRAARPVVVLGEAPGGTGLPSVEWISGPFDKDRMDRAIRHLLGGPPEGRPCILYVEDDGGLQELMRESLVDRATTCSAQTIGEARARIADGSFDLVVLDLDLPDGSGIDLLPVLPANVPVIVFTALEVDASIADRVMAVVTKSRTSEAAVIELILDALQTPAARENDDGRMRRIA